jgi:SAM-dependent methyltransferase
LNPGEHEIMARVEETHWWYRGLRDVITRCLRESRFRLPPSPHVLDAGCGSGQNLKALGELLQPAYLGGFDISEEGLGFARRKVPAADLYQSDLSNPTLHVGELDLVVSFDVICLPGVQRAREGLKRIVAALRPGGLFVLNLPAYDWLYSEHDAAVHTTERYTAQRVRTLLQSLDLRVELLSYRLFFLFPLIVLRRLPTVIRARPRDREARSDLHAVPTEYTNRSLLAVLKVENQLIARGGRLPWGSSVFAIGRKV